MDAETAPLQGLQPARPGWSVGSDVDHMRALYVQTPATLIGYVLGAAVVIFLYAPLAERWRLWGWVGAVALLWLVRLLHYLRYLRQPTAAEATLLAWRRSWRVLVLLQGSMWGIAVWLFARDGVHVGASGLVYGLVSYIFVAGLIRRERRAIAASLLVAFMYGALVWGVLPIRHGVSWETHLAAALIGVLLAIVLRHRDNPPHIRYSWEDEKDDADESGEAQTGDSDTAQRS